MFAKGLLNKEGLMRLVGREQTVSTTAEESVAETFGGTVADKLAVRKKELDERAMKLDEKEKRVAQEISRLQKLETQISNDIKAMQGELDSQDTKKAAQLKKFSEKIAGMNPKTAAKLLEGLSVDDAVRVLDYIEPRTSGKILDEMDPAGPLSEITKKILSGT